MITTLHAILDNIYESNEFRDKTTGEVKPPVTYAQLIVENVLKNGSTKKEFVNISLNDKLADEFRGKIGESIDIKCNISSSEKMFIQAI